MDALAVAIEAALREMARDPSSAGTAESIALTVQAVDELLDSPGIRTLLQPETDERARIVDLIADKIRTRVEALRNMLSLAAQEEQRTGPIAWTSRLADAIRRLETEFHDIPNLSRQYPPPIVRLDEAERSSIYRRP